MTHLKKLIAKIALPCCLAFASSSSWALFINDGLTGSRGADVGDIDTFLAETSGLANSQPGTEETWAEAVLLAITGTAVDLTYADKQDGGSCGGDLCIQTTEDEFDNVFPQVFAAATASNSPSYFIVKKSTWWALFSNVEDMNWAVFNAALLSEGFNLAEGAIGISHLTEFNGDGDTTSTDTVPVPLPGTLLLVGLGLLGLTSRVAR